MLSEEEQFEYNMMEMGVEYDETREELSGKYKEMPSHLIMAVLNIDGDVETVKQDTRQVVCRITGRTVPHGKNMEVQNVMAEALNWGNDTNIWDVIIRKTAAIYKPFFKFRKNKMMREGHLSDEQVAE